MSTVSIVIPVYNKEKHLRKCLDSILAQTYADYEVVLIDDGSTDGSAEICKDYVKESGKFRYFYENNGGQTVARRKGVQLAKFDCVAFIDADDYIDKDYFEVLMNELQKNESDLLASNLFSEDGQNRTVMKTSIPYGTYYSNQMRCFQENVIWSLKEKKQGISHSLSGKIFRKNLLIEIFDSLPDNLIVYEDGVTVFGYACRARSAHVINYTGYHYVQYANSSIHSIREDYFTSLENVKNEYIKIAKQHDIFEQTRKQIAEYISRQYKNLTLSQMGLSNEPHFVIPFTFPEGKCRIAIYGAGVQGQRFFSYIDGIDDIQCTLWVDRDWKNKQGGVRPIEELLTEEYDFILIAIEDPVVVHAITAELLSMGIDYRKIWPLEIGTTL